jgi:hypothetical protein
MLLVKKEIEPLLPWPEGCSRIMAYNKNALTGCADSNDLHIKNAFGEIGIPGDKHGWTCLAGQKLRSGLSRVARAGCH